MPDNPVSAWKATLAEGLRALERQQQRRSLVQICGVDFCSNDYLGLAEHPALRQAVVRAVENSPRLGATASRLLSGHHDDWTRLEQEFAQFAGTEAALFFGSGYAANMGLLSALVGRDDVIYSDVLNHASLIDGIRLSGARKVIYPHLDLNALEVSLRQDAGAPWRRIIVTESVFSMNGDVAPLKDMAALAEKHGAAMIVDEAHATGMQGRGGHGLAAEAGILAQVLATVHTCGKTLASAGAFVCAPAVVKEHLINHARTFIFSTALPPYFAGQIQQALRLATPMDAERATLLKRARGLNAALCQAGFATGGSASQIVPVVLGSNEDTLQAAEQLQREGFAVRAIRPPTVPVGQSRLRLSLTTKIAEDDLTRLVQCLIDWRKQKTDQVTAKHA